MLLEVLQDLRTRLRFLLLQLSWNDLCWMFLHDARFELLLGLRWQELRFDVWSK